MEDFVPPTNHIEPYMFRRPEYPDSLFWTTVISCPGSTDQVAGLSATGWENVEHYSPEIRLCASSQLACSFLLSHANGPEVWAPGDDLQYAQRYPVLLSFQTPAFIDEQGSLQSLEHMVLGSSALVLHTNTCSLYHVDQLGNPGMALCQQLQGGIDVFTFPGLFDDTVSDTPRSDDAEYHQMLRAQQRQRAQGHWAQIHQTAKELASLYWQMHQRTQMTLLPGERSTFPPAVFQERSIAPIPASLALQSALAAYSNAQSHQASGWQQHGQGLTYVYQRSSKEYAHVEWRPGISPSTPSDLELLWSKIRTFDDHDGDVLLCLLAHWVAAPKDVEGYVWLSSEVMLSYRGIRPRSYIAADGAKHDQSYRQEDMAAVSTSVEHIRNTHVTLQQQTQQESQPKRRGRPRKRILQLESYLITVTDFLQQRTMFAEHEAASDQVAIAWRYRPGNCIEAFLDQQFASLFQQSLNYDPLREQWEKRLSRYFTFHLYGGQHSTITRTVSAILDELSLPINKNDPDKTKKRFEKAMERLRLDHQIAVWSYLEDLASLPSRQWLHIWRSYQIQVQATTLPTTLRHQRK